MFEKCFLREIRALVLTGASKSFESGGDLKVMQAAVREKLSQLLGDLTHMFHCLIQTSSFCQNP